MEFFGTKHSLKLLYRKKNSLTSVYFDRFLAIVSSNVVITGFSNIKSKLMDATSNHGAYTLFTSNQELASGQGRNGQYDFKSTDVTNMNDSVCICVY